MTTSIYTVWRLQTAQRNHSKYISRQLKRLFPYHDSKMALCVVHSLSFRKFRMLFFPSPKHTYFTLISAFHVTACLISRVKKKTMPCLWDAKIFCGRPYVQQYAYIWLKKTLSLNYRGEGCFVQINCCSSKCTVQVGWFFYHCLYWSVSHFIFWLQILLVSQMHNLQVLDITNCPIISAM